MWQYSPVLGPGLSSISPDKMRRSTRNTTSKILRQFSSPDPTTPSDSVIFVLMGEPVTCLDGIRQEYHDPILTLHWVRSIMTDSRVRQMGHRTLPEGV